MMDISIIIPVYNERENLPILVSEIHEVLDPRGIEYEIICVDDGSVDQSYQVLVDLSRDDARLVVVRFRRNFGQTAAMQAGFDMARGQVVFPMDADLQYDPADIPGMLDKLNEGYDLVAGWRASRKDTFINRRLPSIVANWLISATTNVRLHDYGCTIKAIRAEVAKELRLYGEMHRFIPAMASLIGARMVEMKVNHRPRKFGVSKYGIGRTTRVILDLLTVLFLRTYLVKPMQFFGLTGIVLGFIGTLICGWLTVEKLFFAASLADRPLLFLGIVCILVGLQLTSLGLMADVQARTYYEAQKKPPYYIRNTVCQGKDQQHTDTSLPGMAPVSNESISCGLSTT
jgi:glycosyltransferase involved in cell wall biosynthesis